MLAQHVVHHHPEYLFWWTVNSLTAIPKYLLFAVPRISGSIAAELLPVTFNTTGLEENIQSLFTQIPAMVFTAIIAGRFGRRPNLV